MKKKILLLAAVAICVAILATGTLAYYTSQDKVHNVITTGEIDIDLVETRMEGNTEVPYPTDPVEGIMPGADHSKIVNVKNTGSNDAWVRVKVDTSVTVGGEELDSSVLTLDINNTKWIDGKDGYYYYNAILTPGSTTAEPLFTTVHFDAVNMDNDYQNAEVVIDVQAYATQVANNGSTVLEAKGWPSDILTTLFG